MSSVIIECGVGEPIIFQQVFEATRGRLPLFISKRPITVAQWSSLMLDCPNADVSGSFVKRVSWQEGMVFCHRVQSLLSESNGRVSLSIKTISLPPFRLWEEVLLSGTKYEMSAYCDGEFATQMLAAALPDGTVIEFITGLYEWCLDSADRSEPEVEFGSIGDLVKSVSFIPESRLGNICRYGKKAFDPMLREVRSVVLDAARKRLQLLRPYGSCGLRGYVQRSPHGGFRIAANAATELEIEGSKNG